MQADMTRAWPISSAEADRARLIQAIAGWQDREPSVLSDHGQCCCRAARLWLQAMDRSALATAGAADAPAWLRDRYRWGPVHWPLYWCQALQRETLDCGAYAAIGRVLFAASRGVNCLPAQLILQFRLMDVRHWRRQWESASCPTDWIAGDLIYHEVCAVANEAGVVRLWNPTDGCWIERSETVGYGSAVAVRLIAPATLRLTLSCGRPALPGQWTMLPPFDGPEV
jgi:hypothetical protein